MRDYDIRVALKKEKLAKYYCDGASKVVDELDFSCTGARIDVAVVNCSLHGFEIKSSVDTLGRLEGQIAGYSKVLDYLTVVTEEKHLKHVQELVPEWVGIYLCYSTRDKVKFKRVKRAKKNGLIEPFFLLKMLWKEELITILEAYSIPFKKSFRIWTMCEIISEALDKKLISELVRSKLKARKNWKPEIFKVDL
ncbi:sce7726 family protein [uncultured Pontibacter sp.]|uniref:sce7726 family protein n=1 Tax=uncultured Pontibacter sp. TaxID=453356 RepID=UPI00260DE787|nr:sce7726 family protein [uncultured Pontibacter sp.]